MIIIFGIFSVFASGNVRPLPGTVCSVYLQCQGIERVAPVDQAVRDGHPRTITLERAKHPVPHDQDATVVLVQTLHVTAWKTDFFFLGPPLVQCVWPRLAGRAYRDVPCGEPACWARSPAARAWSLSRCESKSGTTGWAAGARAAVRAARSGPGARNKPVHIRKAWVWAENVSNAIRQTRGGCRMAGYQLVVKGDPGIQVP